MLTGIAAGTLSTCSLSYAADHYPYARRGRAMGVLSMAYFAAFVLGVPVGAVIAARSGWPMVFGGFSLAALVVLTLVVIFLPRAARSNLSRYSVDSVLRHFQSSDRLAGMAAALLTSGGI